MKIIESRVIPLYSEKAASWEMQVDLSGRRYTFAVSYLTRPDAWVMSISDANGDLLISGLRLVPGVSFLEKYRASVPALPPGELRLVDKEENQGSDEVTRDNLSNRFVLTYTVIGEE